MESSPTRRDLAFGVVRVAFAALAVVAMSYQFAVSSGRGAFSAGNFFSFFTIQSNIFAVAVLVSAALVRPAERTLRFDAVRGSATLYIAITGVVFTLLLRGHQESVNTSLGWVNTVVHELIPLVLVADWLVDPPVRRLPLRLGAVWLAYPAVWFPYTLIRGASSGWYPYPFVDVADHGYGRVLLNAAILAVGFYLGALAIVVLGNWRSSAAGPVESLEGVG